MLANQVKYLIVHCSDSPHGRGDNAETIHRWHLARGWDGIGYHYVITEDGTIENGRPEYWNGAHVNGYNHKSIGVCLIGEGIYTLKQLHSLENLMCKLKVKYPHAEITGHTNMDSSKGCPLFDVKEWAATSVINSDK